VFYNIKPFSGRIDEAFQLVNASVDLVVQNNFKRGFKSIEASISHMMKGTFKNKNVIHG